MIRKSEKFGRKTCAWVAVLIISTLAGMGCDLIYPPPEDQYGFGISLTDLQNQLGINSGKKGAGKMVDIPESSTTSEARSLILGAVIIHNGGPYSNDTPITEGKIGELQQDIQNSLEYMEIISLPTSREFFEVKLPPEAAGNWQVMVEASRLTPEYLSDLATSEQQGGLTYFGFSNGFMDPSNLEPPTIKLIRGCLANPSTPPNGCVQFDVDSAHTPVVSASVEIIGVVIDGVLQTPGGFDPGLGCGAFLFPWVVRDVPSAGEMDPAKAKECMSNLVDPTPNADSVISVISTHADSTYYLDNCSTFDPSLLDLTNLDFSDPEIAACLQAFNTDLGEDLVPTANIASPITDPEIVLGEAVLFSGNVSSGDPPFTHSWIFDVNGCGVVSPTTSTAPVPSPVTFIDAADLLGNPGCPYHVRYQVNDVDGDVSTAEIDISVYFGSSGTEFGPVITGISYIRSASSLEITAVVDSPLLVSYTWSGTGDFAALSQTTNPGVISPFNDADSGDITFTVTDSSGIEASYTRTIDPNDFPYGL